jgi:phosphomannomutase
MRQLKIGPSGIRGVVGDGLTPELLVDFACAFGTWCDGGSIVIGHDSRRSSPMAHSAVLSGLLATGVEVVDLGLSPTPLISFAVRELGAAGGISISGSHNDARWNALKFLGPDGAHLNAVKSEELLDTFHARDFARAPWEKIRKAVPASGIEDRYIECLLAWLDADAIRSRRFRIVVDLCNGACAGVTRRLLDALRCEMVPLNLEATGEFAHPPAPNPANMRQLATLIQPLEVDLGVALNVDGDRAGFVTAGGEPLSEEFTLPLAARARMRRRPGPIVTSLSTSRMVEGVAREAGQQVMRTNVGEGHVMDRGLTEEASIAGEGSGGVAILPNSMTYDALLTLGVILEWLAVNDQSLKSATQELPSYTMRKGEIPCTPDAVHRVLERFRRAYEGRGAQLEDGVRLEWDDAWIHVRASNTEPILRVIAEAEAPERADELDQEAMGFARRTIHLHSD